MKYLKRTSIILMLIILALLFINTSSAKSVILELCTDKNCYNYKDNNIQINYNEPLILKVKIINEEGKLMCWKGIQYNFKYISSNIGDSFNKGEKSVGGGFYGDNSKEIPFCFSDSNKISNEMYIPLKDYDTIDSSKRIGSWAISDFKLTFNGLTYYQDVSLKQEISSFNNQNSFDGNEIKYTVITEEPKAGWFPNVGKIGKGFLIGLNAILVVWGGIFVTRKKSRTLGVILFILALILFSFGFYS